MIAPRRDQEMGSRSFLFRASAKQYKGLGAKSVNREPGLSGEEGGGLVSVLPTIPYNKLVRVYDPTEIVVYLLKHISTRWKQNCSDHKHKLRGKFPHPTLLNSHVGASLNHGRRALGWSIEGGSWCDVTSSLPPGVARCSSNFVRGKEIGKESERLLCSVYKITRKSYEQFILWPLARREGSIWRRIWGSKGVSGGRLHDSSKFSQATRCILPSGNSLLSCSLLFFCKQNATPTIRWKFSDILNRF